MISAIATHTGLVRKNNEDFIRADDNLGIYLLADGIGGLNAGEVASALAVETVYGILRKNIAHTAADGFFELMFYAMHTAHWEINTKSQSGLTPNRMGTTLVTVVLRENRAYIVNAGDSRCYILQNESDCSSDDPPEKSSKKIMLLTNDHTLGDRLLASGIPLEQISKKQFHTLTQSVGCGDPPYPDFCVVELKPDDLLLICSDGLTDMLHDTEIEALLSNKDASLDTLALNLINAANDKGGRDNISVVLIASPVSSRGTA